MKVCFVGAYPPETGSVSQQAYWAAHGLAERGHQILVVTATGLDAHPAQLDERDAASYQPEFPASGGFVRVMRAGSEPGRTSELGPASEPGADRACRDVAAVTVARLASHAAVEFGCEAFVAFAAGPYAAAGYLAAQQTCLPLLSWPPAATGCLLPPMPGRMPAAAEMAAHGHQGSPQFPSLPQFVDGWDRRIRALAGTGGRLAGTGGRFTSLDLAAELPDMFAETSIAAAARACQGAGWLQFGVTLPPGAPDQWAGLYAAIREAADDALRAGLAAEFFYMHKPPGMRLRFQETSAGVGELGRYLRGRLDGWRDDGLITGWRPGVYEPEAHLFGGPVSMRSVHRVFTADSLAWLGYHALPASEPSGPAWAMSLLMVRGLLAALRIVGWEDLDVWDRVRRQAGRLAPTALGRQELDRLSELLKPAWSSAAALSGRLSVPAQRLGDAYLEAVLDEGRRWSADYFSSSAASVGPREAAAFMIIFHWNRGRFSVARQALLTQALLSRQIGADQ